MLKYGVSKLKLVAINLIYLFKFDKGELGNFKGSDKLNKIKKQLQNLIVTAFFVGPPGHDPGTP
jgi:hypothetical protein